MTILAGQDRYETAVLVADQLEAKLGEPAKAVIVSGACFADALAAAPLASAKGWPILLASGEQYLPQVTQDELARLEVTSVLEVGTQALVDMADVTQIVGGRPLRNVRDRRRVRVDPGTGKHPRSSCHREGFPRRDRLGSLSRAGRRYSPSDGRDRVDPRDSGLPRLECSRPSHH